MKSFKDVYMNENSDKPETKEPINAASVILASHITKDKKVSFRINSQTYNQFNIINLRLGATNGSVINTLIAKYIQEHKDLLD